VELELLLLLLLRMAMKDSSAHFAIKHTRQCRVYTPTPKNTIPVNG
jgi:hypothetical protein